MKKNNSGLATDASKLSLSNILSLSINMLTIMLLSRFISKYEYGTYSQISLINILTISIFSFGLPNCINYFYARADTIKEKQRFIIVYFSTITIIFLFVCFILNICSTSISNYFQNDYLTNFSHIFSTLPLFSIIIQSNSNFLVAQGRANKLIILTLINNIALLISIVAIRLLKLSFAEYMTLYIAIQASYAVYVYFISIKYSKFEKNIISSVLKNFNALQYLKKLLIFSIPLGLGTMISTLSIELDKLVIGGLMDTDSLAVYTNASKELPVTLILSSFTAVLLPKMSRMYKHKDNSGIIKIWNSSIVIGFTIMIFFTTSIITFAPQVISFLYSDKYLSGTGVFIICTTILVLRSTYFGIILNITGNTKYVFYSSLFALIINLISNFLFFKIFGFIGPAISTVLCILFVNIFQLKYTSKILNISMSKIFPWSKLLKIFITNIFIASVFIISSIILRLDTSSKSIIIAIILGLIWAIIYFLINRKQLKAEWQYLNKYSIEE